jgi:hypothetical protein
MATIKMKTGRSFIPSLIQKSPFGNQKEVMIMMRYTENLDRFTIDKC